jgi:hypothetical protein
MKHIDSQFNGEYSLGIHDCYLIDQIGKSG